MRRALAFILLAATVAVAAVENEQVRYLGGTLPGVKEGTIGRLDATEEQALVFEHPGGRVAIPYAKITAYEYTNKMAHDLGALPAISVGLFKGFQRRHYFRIAYADASGVSQVLLLEVAKQAPPTVLAILQARAPQACRLPRPCMPRN